MTAGQKRDAPSARESFYEAAMAEAEQYPRARDVEGLDDELAVLRMQLRRGLMQEDVDLKVVLACIDQVRKLVLARYRMSPKRADDFTDSIAAVIEQFTNLTTGDEP